MKASQQGTILSSRPLSCTRYADHGLLSADQHAFLVISITGFHSNMRIVCYSDLWLNAFQRVPIFFDFFICQGVSTHVKEFP